LYQNESVSKIGPVGYETVQSKKRK